MDILESWAEFSNIYFLFPFMALIQTCNNSGFCGIKGDTKSTELTSQTGHGKPKITCGVPRPYRLQRSQSRCRWESTKQPPKRRQVV